MDGFTHVHPIEVRFRDIDALGHVNNATLFTFIETARVPYMMGLGLWSPETSVTEIPYIIADSPEKRSAKSAKKRVQPPGEVL